MHRKLDSQQTFIHTKMKVASDDDSGHVIDDDVSDNATPESDKQLTQHERERKAAASAVAHSLRECLMLRHQCYFFQGDIYHMLEKEAEEGGLAVFGTWHWTNMQSRRITKRKRSVKRFSPSHWPPPLLRLLACIALSDAQCRLSGCQSCSRGRRPSEEGS